uniref:Uncharacterized protein n=1 Tax=Candidatus Methanogaster sp. ANME-2c ERB4 TaxID=2759911 RepID=A0A7G9Y9H0_9EURY|nr:hypothetical protein CIGHHIFM_00003 [Methanosarcinales archaeon ANME-2c ERB4]QNO43904.1 hypothetical protein NANOEKIO_00003 [Methanosarcinales archaeon ANME-2c ERB4]QNO44457.1 hypothetical protein ELEJOALA_00003 [Methanosarcinales archaeon ANME-2c ERB4]QNO44654.1 hypothetical protein GAFOMAFF_00023 [Methanosarcinales archaeon ANME-2c ERB4]QNO45189.1 hypothetical protein KDMJNAGO_00003 [Methanosarcinales archaeon ANME-2c ERB4]
MPVCRDCDFYKPIDDSVGDCFGIEVPGDGRFQLSCRCVPAKGLMIDESRDFRGSSPYLFFFVLEILHAWVQVRRTNMWHCLEIQRFS